MTRIWLPILIKKPLAKRGHTVMQNCFRKEKGPTNNTEGKGATKKEKIQPQRMCTGARVSDTT